MASICSPPLPLFVSVTVCADPVAPCVPKFRTLVEKLGAGAVPLPVKLTVCGLVGSPSVKISAAVRMPLAVGVNVTLTAQAAPAATLAPQVFSCAKSPGFVPPMLMPVIASAVAPVFFSVTV